MPNTQEYIDQVAKKRGLPEIKKGTKCEVDGRKGIVVGGNHSANLNVLFDDCNHVTNCHPYYKMRIFNKWGGPCYESDDLYSDPCPDCGCVLPVDSKEEHRCMD